MVSAKAFWKRVELISPGRPWVAADLGHAPRDVLLADQHVGLGHHGRRHRRVSSRTRT
jgi:hypothetical protein